MKPQIKSVTIGKLTFVGTYTPEEPMVMYYPDGSGYPGSPAEFEISEIIGSPLDLVDLLETLSGKELWTLLDNYVLENGEIID